MLLRKLEVLDVLGMSRRKVGIHFLYASNSSAKASIQCGLERLKNITACCIVFWTLLKRGIDVFSSFRHLSKPK